MTTIIPLPNRGPYESPPPDDPATLDLAEQIHQMFIPPFGARFGNDSFGVGGFRSHPLVTSLSFSMRLTTKRVFVLPQLMLRSWLALTRMHSIRPRDTDLPVMVSCEFLPHEELPRPREIWLPSAPLDRDFVLCVWCNHPFQSSRSLRCISCKRKLVRNRYMWLRARCDAITSRDGTVVQEHSHR